MQKSHFKRTEPSSGEVLVRARKKVSCFLANPRRYDTLQTKLKGKDFCHSSEILITIKKGRPSGSPGREDEKGSSRQ